MNTVIPDIGLLRGLQTTVVCVKDVDTDRISLRSLAHHACSVPHDLPLFEVERVFRDKGVSFLALTKGGIVSGLCSRESLGMLLGARYGFALHAKAPASVAQVRAPLIFREDTPVRVVLEQSQGRTGHAFLEDVVIVDSAGGLAGLVACEKLANLQTRLVSEQVRRMDRQNAQLRRSAMALEEARGLWMGLFDSSLVGVALVGTSGDFVSMNRCCADLLNMSGLPSEGLHLGLLLCEGGEEAAGTLLSTARNGGARRIELRLRVPDRGERLFRLDLSWIAETSQHCICFDDITEQRTLEQRMRQNEKQLLFDTLVAGIAHELNNKITPVLGFASFLLEIEKDQTSKTYLECMRGSMEESASIIRQLLHLSRPETGRMVKTDLRSLIDEVLLMLKFQLSAAKIAVECERPSEELFAVVDSSQIKQVLINLVINAIHAMEGRAGSRLSIHSITLDGVVNIRVSDNGCGIPRHLHARIFDPFFSTKGPDKGSGLGLSVCLSIARQHKGLLSLESETGKGACFTLSLPLDPGRSESVTRPPLMMSDDLAERPGPLAPRPELRVLVVDDEEPVRHLMAELLTRGFGCRVSSAGSGEAGMVLAAEGDFELIVSDVRMPGMDGGAFYQRLRELKPEIERKFVLTTGYAGPEGEDELLARLEVPVLRKPFSASRFLDFCRPYLARG